MTKTCSFISLLCFAILLSHQVNARTQPFIIGADISWVPEEENGGAEYYDDNTKQDIFTILKNHKFNYIRLRIFNDPAADSGGSVATTGAVYSGYSSGGYCDLAHTKAMALRIKNAGMKFFLDFHYSDNWADPGKQYKPHAWANATFSQLTDSIRIYTKNVLAALKNQGTIPDMVQIGNEITAGMLWPDGANSGGFDNLAALLKAGIAGVKDVDSSIKIVLHIDRGNDYATTKWWMNNVIAKGVKFDIIGESCYQTIQGEPGDWQATFDSLVKNYPAYSFIIAEYSQKKRAANDIIFKIPNERGLGAFIWEPLEYYERIFSESGTTWTAIDSLINLYDTMYADYGNDTVSTSICNSKLQKKISAYSAINADAWLSGKGTLRFYSSNASSAEIIVYNFLGKKCLTLNTIVLSGFNSVPECTSNRYLPAGLYIVSINNKGLKALKN
jgi:arabinogalactan endo-1,4-beta-galactosidase